ncbi:MAG: hypothetical protein KA715_04955 [Xanthomonadaceae bacterium]|nr:hypothetical protein [Xanthomonadaceae bacterium]
MLTSDRCIELLEELERLLRLNEENVFKVRAFEKAQQSLSGMTALEERARAGNLTEIPGIGKGIAEVLTEFLLKDKCSLRDELLAKLPPGLLDLTRIPGLGPKKAKTIIEELGIHSVGELEYACRENRLATLKGFGEKAQAQTLAHIEAMKAREKKALFSDTETWVVMLLSDLKDSFDIELTGQMRRKSEIIDSIEFVAIGSKTDRSKIEKKIENFLKDRPTELPITVHMTEKTQFAKSLLETTATPEWLKISVKHPESEALDPDLMESLGVFDKGFKVSQLLTHDSIQGVFHNHTTRSDGRATAEQMIRETIKLGYKYIGLSDHSQSAFYAQGLKVDALKEQKKEIEKLRNQFPEITIFWGVESDILQDGSLDYPDSVLKEFDFVVGSVHSRFKMDREVMTKRILAAIENPYCSMIGHLTGRILLAREGYQIDYEKIFKAAGREGTAIEINANPQRLDVDWRHGDLLREYKVMTCINPDAHDTSGLSDTRFGITVARKALLPMDLVLNTRSANEAVSWLRSK